MVLPVIIGVFVGLVLVLAGAQKFRDRHRYRGGDSTLETDGHASTAHVDLKRTTNPALLGEQQQTLGMGFPGGGAGAQGPNQ